MPERQDLHPRLRGARHLGIQGSSPLFLLATSFFLGITCPSIRRDTARRRLTPLFLPRRLEELSRWTGDDLEQGTGGTTLSGCCAMQLLPLDETSRCVPNCGPLWAGVDIFGSAGQELVSALLSQPIASVQPPDRVFSPWLSCCWEAVYCSWRTYLSLDKTEFLWAQAMIRPLSPILRCMAF